MSPVSSPSRASVLIFINRTFDAILTEIGKRPFGKPEIVLHRIKSFEPAYSEEQQRFEWNVNVYQVNYSWPGRSGDEAWRFACVGKILSEIKIALESGRTVTKRDIYYHDPILFGSQHVVDRYLDDIAYTCKVSRTDLNVAASPHGLYIGLRENDNKVYSINGENDLGTEFPEYLKWVLVVEKEATFKQLAEQRYHRSCSLGLGVIVTGKGYPDLSTRQFVQALSERYKPSVTCFGLFDADPDGLAIMNCYRYGSRVTIPELERSEVDIEWLGVRIHDVAESEFRPLTAFDRAKVISMLSRWQSYREAPNDIGHCEMLRHMLMLNVKAEIQAVDGGSESLLGWLDKRMLDCRMQEGS